MSVGGPLVEIITCTHHSFIENRHFGQVCNSGAAILCLHRVQCAALDQSLAKEKSECLPDGIKTIN